MIRCDVDGVEPLFAAALAEAAPSVADERLDSPDLGPPMLARELHISVRTLRRAFAATGESSNAYVRRRRLEVVLVGSSASVSALAARWQFADSSHFIREFKRALG